MTTYTKTKVGNHRFWCVDTNVKPRDNICNVMILRMNLNYKNIINKVNFLNMSVCAFSNCLIHYGLAESFFQKNHVITCISKSGFKTFPCLKVLQQNISLTECAVTHIAFNDLGFVKKNVID